MSQTKTGNKYPSAVYAAAGVGDLVYEQLRRLQDKALTFGTEQAPQWKHKVAEFGAKVDADKVRESVVTGTQVAAVKATQVYGTLVARGAKVFEDKTAEAGTKPAQDKTAQDKTAEAKTTATAAQDAPVAAVKKTAPVAKKGPSAKAPAA